MTSMRQIATKYPCPMGGYGRHFRHWLVSSDPQPYGSFGNGSAMRVSPCGVGEAPVRHASVAEQDAASGLSADEIRKKIMIYLECAK